MGFFDSVKKMLGTSSDAAPPPVALDEETESDEDEGESFDLAGFDPDDEEAFFNAILQMESEGLMGGTPESRAEIMQQFRIRDHLHWQTVKDSMYRVLAQRHGSGEAAVQAEMNWRAGQSQKMIANNVAAKAASGEMKPAFGISLEAWAAINAAIAQGANFEDLLKGAGIDRARWDRASAEWQARMARDTTFAITTVYGNAFQAASQGKFSNLAREANAARAANTALSSPLPMSHEQYFEIMYEQAYTAAQGKNAADALKPYGLTIVDFCDLSSFMGYHFARTGVANHEEYAAAIERAQKKAEAKYPGIKADVDIAF